MPLPPDLSRLGEELQRAADREVARQRRLWLARTATVAATCAFFTAALAPSSLAPGLRTPAGIPAAELSRCTDAKSMRRAPCSYPPALVTDAATGRESETIVAHLSDAAQSGTRRPWVDSPGRTIF